jgi:hypothetical protein
MPVWCKLQQNTTYHGSSYTNQYWCDMRRCGYDPGRAQLCLDRMADTGWQHVSFWLGNVPLTDLHEYAHTVTMKLDC